MTSSKKRNEKVTTTAADTAATETAVTETTVMETPVETIPTPEPVLKDVGEHRRVPHDLIDFDRANRPFFKTKGLEELAQNIALNDVLQEITLQVQPDGRMRVVAGERRVRASRMAGFKDISSHVRNITDAEARQIRLAENEFRQDLHFMEEAYQVAEMLQDYPSAVEIAARMGKTPKWVYGRLRLKDLIEPIQEMCLSDKFNINQAFQIALLVPESQQHFFDGQCANWKKNPSWCIYDFNGALNRYKYDLKTAPFDTTKADLLPEVGACTGCPYNSAVAASLWPEDEAKSLCLKTTCYDNKCTASFSLTIVAQFTEAKPEALVFYEKPTEQLLTKVGVVPELLGLPRFEYNSIDEILKPEKPRKEDHKQGWEPSSPLDKASYKEAIQEYEQALASYDRTIALPKVKRGIYIRQNQTRVIYFNPEVPKSRVTNSLIPSAKTVSDAVKAGIATVELVQGEIKKINEREKGNQEKDRQAVQEIVYDKYGKLDEKAFWPKTQTAADLAASRYVLFDRLSTNTQTKFLARLFPNKRRDTITPEQLYKRFLVLDKIEVSYLSRMALSLNSSTRQANTFPGYFFYQMVVATGFDVTPIEAAQKKIATQRQKGVNIKLAEWNQKLTTIKSKKASVKKIPGKQRGGKVIPKAKAKKKVA